MQDELLRFNAVRKRVSLSRTTVWRLEKAGQFPKRRQISSNCVGWSATELDKWIATRTFADTRGGVA